jgi:peptidoglycan/xylan/chitin deacetylase (PgdA/CDA1 family)
MMACARRRAHPARNLLVRQTDYAAWSLRRWARLSAVKFPQASSQVDEGNPALRTLLTLDYEIFFGPRTGSVARCLVEPTQALLDIAARHGARLVFFVDAGYLLRLRAEMARESALRADHDAMCRQLEALVRAGHEIQLHIHPHWEDATWRDGWRLEGTRFALHSFAEPEIAGIVRRYAAVLREIAGPDAARAYRAGGWVIQPFRKLRAALLDAGVRIDSTVYAGGRSQGEIQPYDFRGTPGRSRWRFDTDPLVEDPEGPFLEVPIASRRVGPAFFWRFALAKKLGGARHRAFGDGRAIPMGRADMIRRLCLPSASVVSMDGYKASFLARAAREYRARGMEDFVVIGHPKALTPYSLERLDAFLAGVGETETFSSYSLEINEALPPSRRRRAA